MNKLIEQEEQEQEEEDSTTVMVEDNNMFITEDIIIPKQKFVPGIKPKMDIDSTVTIYGKRRTGKTVFIKYLLQFFKHEIPWGWVFTLTKFNSQYGTIFPEEYIFSDFDADKLNKIMKRQKLFLKKYFEQIENGNQDPINPIAVVIWDDYMGNDVRFNKMLHRYYYTGRHYATFNIFATQYVCETPPAIRTNTDFAVIFNTDHRPSLELYAENFAGKMKKNDFISFIKDCTKEKHSFLFIDNNPNVDYQHRFYIGKAEKLDANVEYIIGCKEYWDESKKQLESIYSGKMQKRLEARAKLTEHHPVDPEYISINHISEMKYPEKSKNQELKNIKINTDE